VKLDLISLFIATFPFIWLTLLYLADYRVGFTENTFFVKALEKISIEHEIIRELCHGRLDDRDCPIFRDISGCLLGRKNHLKCICEPWFKPEWAQSRNPVIK